MKAKIDYVYFGFICGHFNGKKIEISHKQDSFWYVYISEKYIGKFPYNYKETNKQAFFNIVEQIFA